MPKVVYNIGDKVFAKVKGYPPWPARIESDTGKKKYSVIFYGTKEVGVIKVEDICYYLKNKDSFVNKYSKRVGYNEAVKEIEAAIEKAGGDGNDYSNDYSNSNESESVLETSVAEKKGVKRKTSTSNEDNESPVKNRGPKSRRKSIASDLKGIDENPLDMLAVKKSRRKSVIPEGENMDTLDASDISDDLNKIKVQKNKRDSESHTEINDSGINETTSEDKSKVSEEMEEDDDNSPVRENITTEQMLKNIILYAEHVKKSPLMYKEKPVEDRDDSKDQIFAIKLPSGTVCGLKLYKDWPLKHTNEYDRALFDEEMAKSLLAIKESLTTGGKSLSEIGDSFEAIPNLNITNDELNEVSYTMDIESRKRRLERLKRESDLVRWDSKIKMNLGLEKALLDEALKCLNEFSEIEEHVDELMFKKHPHVLDTIRRLRKYIGNTKEWKMDGDELDFFSKKAEKIRNEAERIYNRLKDKIKIDDPKPTFWDAFLEVVADFRAHCKNFTDMQILSLCAEPSK